MSKGRAKIGAFCAAILVCTSPAHASGAVAGATEMTQIMNNIELASIVSLDTESLAEEIQQTVTQASQLSTQINQYSTMIQNLRTLPMQMFDKMLGGLPSEAGNLLKLGKASWNLYDSANNAMNTLKMAEYSMKNMNISPSEYTGYMLNAARSKDVYFQEAVKRDTDALKDYEKKIGEWQAASDAAGSATGNLQAQQATAAAVTKSGAEISKLNYQISQLSRDINIANETNAANDAANKDARLSIEKARQKSIEMDKAWRTGSK